MWLGIIINRWWFDDSTKIGYAMHEQKKPHPDT